MKNNGDGLRINASGAVVVGNEFMLPVRKERPPRRLQVIPAQSTLPVVGGGVVEAMPAIPVQAVSHEEAIPVIAPIAPREKLSLSLPTPNISVKSPLKLIRRYKLATFALILLLIGVPAIELGGSYLESRIAPSASALPAALSAHNVAGLSLTVPADQLQQKLSNIINQPATLNLGNQSVPIGSSTIKSWLKISTNAAKTEDYIYLNQSAMTSSLQSLANQYVKSPVNQVTVTHNGVSQVILAGSNGTGLSDPSSLGAQVKEQAKTVMNGNGLQFSTPLVVTPFQAITPANFTKFIEVNLSAMALYVWQNGQIIRTIPVSAGKPSTPTPVGEFHIWTKLTSQTMTGPGYVQPNVPYVNYFDHSGDAIHGAYWRPASVFGAVNASHGCVEMPVAQAQWLFGWTQIGTTVVTHY